MHTSLFVLPPCAETGGRAKWRAGYAYRARTVGGSHLCATEHVNWGTHPLCCAHIMVSRDRGMVCVSTLWLLSCPLRLTTLPISCPSLFFDPFATCIKHAFPQSFRDRLHHNAVVTQSYYLCKMRVLISTAILMLVLSVAAIPRPLKQAKIVRGDDDHYPKHHDKPSKTSVNSENSSGPCSILLVTVMGCRARRRLGHPGTTGPTNDAPYPLPTTAPIPVLLGAPTDAMNHCTHIPFESLNFRMTDSSSGNILSRRVCLSYPRDSFDFLDNICCLITSLRTARSLHFGRVAVSYEFRGVDSFLCRYSAQSTRVFIEPQS
jgi:hypothetical protein